MLRVALSQLTTHFRRFIAIGLAVMLSVMFLSSTLMVGASTNASLGASIGEAYRNADLVATSKNGEPFTQAAVDAAASAPAVEASYAERSTYVTFQAGGGEQYGRLRNLAPASLEGAVISSGSMPANALEAAIDVKTAGHLGLAVGSTLVLQGGGPVKNAKVTISGLLQATNDPFSSSAAQLVASESVLNAVQDAGAGFSGLQFALKPGEDVSSAKEYIAHRMEAAGAVEPVLETAQEKVTSTVAMLSAGQDQLTIVLLAFAGIAILVSTLVVANTFSVLVAQRTRELALLRCLGAGRGQIRGSVMLEALVVGFISSVLGVLAAIGLMTALIAWARSQPEQAFATLAVPPSAIIAGLVAGTLLTVVAALVPAKAATAVAPLAALRPADDASVRNRRGKVRLFVGLAALLGGAALLVYGSINVVLGVALLGGAASFVGILLCSTLFIPTVVALAGRLAAPAGVPGKLAAVNATRNPARTSATAAALLIGVTLVSLMMTGAATSRQAFNDTLAENYPVDLSAQTATEGSGSGDPAQAVSRIKGLDGVSSAVLLQPVGAIQDDASGGTTVYGLSAADAASVLRDNHLKPSPGTVYLPEDSPGGPATLSTAGGQVTLDAKVLRTRHVPAFVESSSVGSGPLAGVPGMVWVKLDDSVSGDRVQALQKEIATALGVHERTVSGAAIERVTFNSIIDVLLLVVTGLLGVAVVIALIGVANTLSLSVLERTRENSLLRALGLTTGQLRGMLAIEAVLVAGVAAIMGAGMGIVYGWLGAQATLGGVATVIPTVPWLQLTAVFAVAVVAGLLASVIPARRAARLSPVEGLATA
ncbi:ABC transporter permease [Paenarthrobacter nicotinovorans]|uniref:ABC transporter permease n=1 Tax=Paenarthrobacter nicotinovorans TaxID=29320 RepID=UPI00166EA7C5|nr:FtsX-like permease family protein [Paenarthrobacter nicotinovorans]MBP2396223.1 putative ABC transport system permease protein [Paenarthrobacter nicotinovorans]UKE97694.1 FtsX-like permease family protein [Paenarthrobacter nicotinovorans]UKF02480.1 FtsX-like permease family protein [Paenarthrobacter nicotinovorans]GGV46193.1 ABC transporter permease [Paenarthrobacter nicotinovorans]